MSWKGTGLAHDESEALERLWPNFRIELDKRRRPEFTVEDFFSWINGHECGVHAIKGDRGKLAARKTYPSAVIINAQNALHHLSAHSPQYVIHDEQSGQQVTLLKHVKRLTYRVLPMGSAAFEIALTPPSSGRKPVRRPMSTAKISEPISGDKLYQERARAAFPLLVRQAEASAPIFYSDLAEELGMPNPRNLNYVLGSIGQSMELLSEAWKEKVPPIQCLVINRGTGLPGEGIGWFLIEKEDFAELPLRQKRAIVDAELQHVYSYPRWREVLKSLSLEPAKADFSPLVSKATGWTGGGEGERHKALKEYVAKHPESIGLKPGTPSGITEYPLPSGDCLDVSFLHKKVWVAAEVKSAISAESDIIRGLFQCVKYRAVMEAVQVTEARQQSARALLVLESALPQSLVALRNLLGIEVVEGVTPRDG